MPKDKVHPQVFSFQLRLLVSILAVPGVRTTEIRDLGFEKIRFGGV